MTWRAHELLLRASAKGNGETGDAGDGERPRCQAAGRRYRRRRAGQKCEQDELMLGDAEAKIAVQQVAPWVIAQREE